MHTPSAIRCSYRSRLVTSTSSARRRSERSRRADFATCPRFASRGARGSLRRERPHALNHFAPTSSAESFDRPLEIRACLSFILIEKVISVEDPGPFQKADENFSAFDPEQRTGNPSVLLTD